MAEIAEHKVFVQRTAAGKGHSLCREIRVLVLVGCSNAVVAFAFLQVFCEFCIRGLASPGREQNFCVMLVKPGQWTLD